MEEAELLVPWDAHRLVNQIHLRTSVLAEQHDEGGTRLRVRAPTKILEDLRKQLAPPA
jgi:hypothetical protein